MSCICGWMYLQRTFSVDCSDNLVPKVFRFFVFYQTIAGFAFEKSPDFLVARELEVEFEFVVGELRQMVLHKVRGLHRQVAILHTLQNASKESLINWRVHELGWDDLFFLFVDSLSSLLLSSLLWLGVLLFVRVFIFFFRVLTLFLWFFLLLNLGAFRNVELRNLLITSIPEFIK